MRVLIIICVVALSMAAPSDVLHSDISKPIPGRSPPDVMPDDDNTAIADPSPTNVMHDDDNKAMQNDNGTATPASADELNDDDNTTPLVLRPVWCQKGNTSFNGIMPCCRDCTRPCGRDHIESIMRVLYPDYNDQKKRRRLLDASNSLLSGYLLADHVRHESYSYVQNLGRADECVVEKGVYKWGIPGGLADLAYVNDKNGTVIDTLSILSPPAIVATMLG